MTDGKHGIGPQEIKEDKPEIERKYSVIGDCLADRAHVLKKIFDSVVAKNDHFVTLDRAPHTKDFPAELVDLPPDFPCTVSYLRTRLYWLNDELAGYKPGDKGRAEIRTEEKPEKGYWQQTLKLGGNGEKTLTRGEFKRPLDDFGTNLDVYKPKQRKAAYAILGHKERKPLVRIDSQSTALLYHPDGRPDVLFEIKFDKGIGRTFNGYVRDIVEVEIEVKKAENLSPKDIERLLDRTETALYEKFNDDLEPIKDSKPAALFRYLVNYRERSKAGFERDFKALSGNKWDELSPL